MAMSAVASVSTSGVLVTISPRALAAAMSIWSKPTLKVASAFTDFGSALMVAALNGSPAASSTASWPDAAAASAGPSRITSVELKVAS